MLFPDTGIKVASAAKGIPCIEKPGPHFERLVKLIPLKYEETPQNIFQWLPLLIAEWQKNGKHSYITFECILIILEVCFSNANHCPQLLQLFIGSLDPDIFMQLLIQALPLMIDSDMHPARPQRHNWSMTYTNYIDTLLTGLSLYLANTGVNLLHKFISQIPYFSGHYLCVHTKSFEELYKFIHSHEERTYNPLTQSLSITVTPHYLTCMHFLPRRIIVSNAPPVKLRKRSVLCREKFACDVSAGGLVSGIKPNLDSQDIWVAYLDTALFGLDKWPSDMIPRIIRTNINIPQRYRAASSLSRGQSVDDDCDIQMGNFGEFLYEKAEQDFLSLQKQLDWFAEHNFAVNPLVILKDDHKPFYNGISNGLFWPAFHNLPEYIIDQYKTDPESLERDWVKYIQVNFYFAIHTARTCRSQDFLWIHDYHLFLVGLILRSLDPTLNSAFFLHIPFRLSDKFMNDFSVQGKSVLRGLLGFHRVGFQTSNDCNRFIELAKKHITGIEVVEERRFSETTIYTVRYENWLCDVGTFPISVKPQKFLQLASHEDTIKWAKKYRSRIMQGRSEGSLFTSVERFDYTKGIIERFKAIDRYFTKYPERKGKDVFYQIASASRGDVSAYSDYHTSAWELANEINERHAIQLDEERQWMPLIIDIKNHVQEVVVALYIASDVMVVTPRADGMNLVIKEAMLANPAAAYVLSTGAGAEQQLFDASLSDHYFRVNDISNTEEFTDLLYRASTASKVELLKKGKILQEFTAEHDVEHWMSTFCDSYWTHNTLTDPKYLAKASENPENLVSDVFKKLHDYRKTAVENLLNNVHVGLEYKVSYQNAIKFFEPSVHKSLLLGLQEDYQVLNKLHSVDRERTSVPSAVFDVLGSSADRVFMAKCDRLIAFFEEVGSIAAFACNIDVLVRRIDKQDILEDMSMQSMMSGLLFSRFAQRYTQHAIIRGDYTELAEICQRVTVPIGEMIVLNRDATQQNVYGKISTGNMQNLMSNDLSLAKGDRMLVVCVSDQDLVFVDWAIEADLEVYVILFTDDRKIQKMVTDKIQFENIHKVENINVFHYAVARRVVNPVKIV